MLTFLVLLRFSNLLADLPLEFGDRIHFAYTDEGWWTRNAVAIVRQGHWYIDDGYNPIVYLPVVPLLQTLWFELFGANLLAARSFTAICSIILAWLIYQLVYRFFASDLALLAPLVILSHFSIFVHSRLALLEIPTLVFILVTLLLILSRQGEVSNFRAILATFVLFAAILTKTTAIFALPMVILFIWFQKQTLANKVRQISIILSIFLIAFLAIGFFLLASNSLSFEYFSSTNILTKLHGDFVSVLIAPVRILFRALQVFPILFPLFLFSVLILIAVPKYRSNPLILLVIFWAGTSFLVLSLSDYAPARYMMVFCVPIAIVVPLIVDFVFTTFEGKIYRQAILCILLLCLGINIAKQINYFASLKYSFVNMAEDVGQYIRQHDRHSKVLMGHFADSVSLVNDLKSVNDRIGHQDLDYRIKKFDPGYYISLGKIRPEIINSLINYYNLELLKTYNVYDNSIEGKPVLFYRLDPLQNNLPN